MATPILTEPTFDKPTSKKPSFMKRLLRKLLWTLLISIGLLALTSAIIVTFFEKNLSAKVLSEVNKSLETELQVEDFELSIFSGFPSASANLRQVVLKDTQGGNLLEADNLAFRFGLFSLFGSSINLHSLVIQNGALYIHVDKKGETNYQVIKIDQNAASDSNTDLSISLKEASLENIELIYSDENNEQETRLLVNDAIFSGEFSSDQFSLTSYAALESDFLDIGGLRYLAGKAIDYDAVLDIDLKNGIYTFEKVDVGIESNVFNISGLIKTIKGGHDIDLVLSSEESNLESIIQLLPEEYLEHIGDFRSTGTFLFNTTIKGKQSHKYTPAIDVNFGLEDGKIKSDRLTSDLKDVSFQAAFSNGKYHSKSTSTFEIKDFKGYFNRELTELELKIENLNDPKIDFKLDGSLPLESIYGLLNTPAITDGDGEIEIQDLRIKGRYEDMLRTSTISKVNASGQIEFDDAELTINKETMIVDRGHLLVKDNDLKVKGIKIEGANSEWTLNGAFHNLIPVLFADSLNTKKAALEFNVQLDAKELDLDRLLAITEVQVAETDVSTEVYDSLMIQQTHQRERLTNLLSGTFDMFVENFNYNKIQGADFDGSLTIENGEMLLDGDVETMDGSMNLEGKVFFEEKPRLKANLIGENINVKKFFYQSENFGQEVLVSDNIKGKLNAHISINAFWDEEGHFLDEKLRVLAAVNILDGELVKFKMLEDFSNVIKVKDLRHIRFTNMQNWLEVRKGQLYLPAMFIRSNAVNLTVTGKHSFDHDIDYGIKVNAGQVLLNKFKKHDPLLKPQKANKKGWFNLYYSIKGNLDDYDTKTDKRGVQKDFESSERRKKQIKKLLDQEFHSIKTIPTESWRDKAPIPEYDEADERDQYLDEIQSKNNSTSIKKNIPEFDEDEDVEFIDFEGGNR